MVSHVIFSVVEISLNILTWSKEAIKEILHDNKLQALNIDKAGPLDYILSDS